MLRPMTRFPLPRLVPGAIALSLTTALLLGSGTARQDRAEPLKTTSHSCGKYTVRLSENGFDDPEDRIQLVQGGRAAVTLTDTSVDFQGCRDLTGDGVPEVILTQFSGGAHCCFTHSVYSLSTPPRLLLRAESAHSEALEVSQLDGRGPLELVGADWRFAYAYGLSFAESPALPVVYAYRGGRYVVDTLNFPNFVLDATQRGSGDEGEAYGGVYLADYATLLLLGKAAEAGRYLRTLPAEYRRWLDNYAPDIRQDLSSAGMEDWPLRAGVPERGAAYGVGGAFSAPGTREYLTLVRGSGTGASLRLFRAQGEGVVGSPALATFPGAAPARSSDGWTLWPRFSVRRPSGRDDAVLEDRAGGGVRLLTYRVGAREAQRLDNDPLAVAAGVLGDLGTVAGRVSAQYKKVPRNAEQRAEVVRRVDAAVARAQPWMKLNAAPLNLQKLGHFSVYAVEVSREDANTALVAGTVDVGLTTPKQDDEYVPGERHTFAIFLEKRGGRWTVTKWQLTPRGGEVPNGWKE